MSTVNALSGASQNSPVSGEEPGKKSPADALANREAFLQMLVAQIQHQDPLNPTDGVQFLSQLAQFSELEQMLGMREELKSLRVLAENAATAPDNAASDS